MATDAATRTPEARSIGVAGRLLGPLLVIVLISAMALVGLLRPLDNWLADQRFAFDTRAPTADVVFVEIDPASLRQVGVWPWPRHVYADLLDRLMAMGAAETVFDIDFSSASTELEDQAFATALDNAGGYASLAAFRQFSPISGQLEVTLPLPRFLKAATPVMVNVVAEQDGVVRRYPVGVKAPGAQYASLAEALSASPSLTSGEFFIDYGIDITAIDRISVADILSGKIAASRLAGKQVVIGSSAQELHDLFVVPRFGTVPGAMLQILATETLKQHRGLVGSGNAMPLGVIATLAVLFILVRTRASLRLELAIGLLLIAATETAGFLLQAKTGLLLRTASIDLALVGLMASAVLQELEIKRRQHAAAARERESMRRILDRVVTDNFDGVVVIDEQGRIVAASDLAETLLGDGAALPGRRAVEVLPEGFADRVSGLLANMTLATARQAMPAELTLDIAGDRRILEYVVTRSEVAPNERDSRRPIVCLTFRDVSERRRNEERLDFLARHDPLTGALSRNQFVATVEAALLRDEDRDEGMTILLFDLGRFRIVNDTLGHSYGDLVLKEAVARLESLELLAVGRVGGDSFALARRGLVSAPYAKRFCDSVIARLCEPYVFDGRRAVLSAHAGLTTTAISGFAGDVLLSHADMALSVAKAIPGNAVEMFAPALDQRLAETQEMEAALREGLEEGQFSVAYQPQVLLSSGEIIGVEALLRWHHPTLGGVSPDRFIPVAEETGIIVELGRFVLETACNDVANWPEHVRLAVNVSPVQFEIGDVLKDVRAALTQSGLAAGRLDLEITEGMFVAKGHPVTLGLERLRLLGIGVALDDFGTGYSSLSYLGRLPIDKLKIDKSFVFNLPDDKEANAIVGTVLTLAQTLGKTVVAEGVETKAQADLLTRLGCDIGQGYLFGKPMPAAEMRDLLGGPKVAPVMAEALAS
jgi:diguanylate cyclase (GGDEF)-like protein/PAS domain S-box-containing protein